MVAEFLAQLKMNKVTWIIKWLSRARIAESELDEGPRSLTN